MVRYMCKALGAAGFPGAQGRDDPQHLPLTQLPVGEPAREDPGPHTEYRDRTAEADTGE